MSRFLKCAKFFVPWIIVGFLLIWAKVYQVSFTCSHVASIQNLIFAEESQQHSLKQPIHTKSDIANEIVSIGEHLSQALIHTRSNPAMKLVAKSLNMANALLSAIDASSRPRVRTEQHHTQGTENIPDYLVCPEAYTLKHPYGGHPWFENGYRTVKCKLAPNFEDIASILLNTLNMVGDTMHSGLLNLISEIRDVHQYIPILIAVTDKAVPEQLHLLRNVTLVHTDSSVIDAWNKLIDAARTPYVLLARDLDHYTNYTRLDRQVRVADTLSAAVVGGSVRTPDGQWRYGCEQFQLRNYSLAYIDGYYLSRNACMYCSHLTGPFVARADFLRSYGFNAQLSSSVAFEEFFIRLRRDGHLIMSCPDAMHLTSDQRLHRAGKDYWRPLVRHLQLNRVILCSQKVLEFNCVEANIDCDKLDEQAHGTIPICCLEEFTHLQRSVYDSLERHGLHPALAAGPGLLGAVTLDGVMPAWMPLSSSVSFQASENSKAFTAFNDDLRRLGLTELQKIIRSKNTADVSVKTEWTVRAGPYKIHLLDAGNSSAINEHDTTRSGQSPTWVLLNGYRFRTETNPGLN